MRTRIGRTLRRRRCGSHGGFARPDGHDGLRGGVRPVRRTGPCHPGFRCRSGDHRDHGGPARGQGSGACGSRALRPARVRHHDLRRRWQDLLGNHPRSCGDHAFRPGRAGAGNQLLARPRRSCGTRPPHGAAFARALDGPGECRPAPRGRRRDRVRYLPGRLCAGGTCPPGCRRYRDRRMLRYQPRIHFPTGRACGRARSRFLCL